MASPRGNPQVPICEILSGFSPHLLQIVQSACQIKKLSCSGSNHVFQGHHHFEQSGPAVLGEQTASEPVTYPDHAHAH